MPLKTIAIGERMISSRLMQVALIQVSPSNVFKGLRNIIDKISLIFQPDYHDH